MTTGTGPNPIEGLIGGQISFGDMLVNLGLGRGLSHGFGAPEYRLVVGFAYSQKTDLDRDGDLIPNSQDQCPDEAEDLDRFEDEDGCPDPDNDQDGVLDRPDLCDSEVEDMDGFEDEDGCPDPDNDDDGILDGDDTCPNDPEDIDLYEDEDSCPELDNDGDGILDGDDACVNQPEDVDGFQDEDGCPDPDNDRDTIPDTDDACPEEAEVINGIDDTDGCAEPGMIALDLRAGTIVLREPVVFFDGITALLAPAGTAAANEIAVALNAYPEQTLRVVVRSRDRADEPNRIAISQRRANAIRDALVAAGVAAERVEASPYALPEGSEGAGYEVEFRISR